MNNLRGFEDLRIEEHDAGASGVDEPRLGIGTNERRMHVRAHNHWVSLLHGRAYPSIKDLDPASIADFGPHSVLLDLTRGVEDPAIAFLGRALREECLLDSSITHISQVPDRSLLSRLTGHYRQIIASRAPIGFEAEFVGTRGHNTLYRGILMPFSSNDDTIDFIYGVINWKELVDAETQALLLAEIHASVRAAPRAVPAPPAWAEGPAARIARPARSYGTLADQLLLAQQTAAAARDAEMRNRATLYRALARAHDFAAAADADPAAYEALLDSAGIALQLRAPMAPVVKLVFGPDHPAAELAGFAAVLAHARRLGVGPGGMLAFLHGFGGGIRAIIRAERDARYARPGRADPARRLADRPALARVAIDRRAAGAPDEAGEGRGAEGGDPGDYVVLLARAGEAGTLDIVAALDGHPALTRRAMRLAAG